MPGLSLTEYEADVLRDLICYALEGSLRSKFDACQLNLLRSADEKLKQISFPF